jgi:hypothetical protein
MEELAGPWRKAHEEELHYLCFLPDSIRVIKMKEDEMAGACSTCRGEEKCMQGFGQET